jgi:hypothetical protein
MSENQNESLNARELHIKASLLSQEAFMCIVNDKKEESISLYEQAFELERQAALSLLNREDIEPTRSVLFRSAAALAKNCHRYKDSEKMIAYGLLGNPPEYIAEQLREIYDDIRKFLRPKQMQNGVKKKVLSAV